MNYILYSNQDKTLKLYNEKEIYKLIYYQEARLPSKENVDIYLKNPKNKTIAEYFIRHESREDAIRRIKDDISRINYFIPLYDEYTRNIYLIERTGVYDRVMNQHYRFPDNTLYDILEKKYKKLEPKIKKLGEKYKSSNLSEFKKTTKMHYEISENIEATEVTKEILKKREFRKLFLMLDFLSQFNLNILKLTYISVFYNYSNKVGKDITVCVKPSFLPHLKHINPYYKRSELINLALNIGIIKPDDVYYDNDKINYLCNEIKENDINSKIIMKHQNYIIENDKVGIIQYYSLQGSYFINKYLRNLAPYEFKNKFLEKNILSMWKLVNDAPAFDKSYILYRFIQNDDHIKKIKVGNNYIVPSFMSTTRDPFYRAEDYQFGFILLKIKIPANEVGVALSIEALSNFSEEQEIILSPLSILKLERKDDEVPYYHTDVNFKVKIRTKYEFTYIGKKQIKLPNRPLYDDIDYNINFMTINQSNSLTIIEKIKYFVSEYTNPMYQFVSTIGDQNYTLLVEWYDSFGVYKDFYAAETRNGFMIYTIINDYIGFTIEIGEFSDFSYIYVNYYFRYSSVPKKGKIKDKDLIDFVAKIGYYFGIKNIIIYAEYNSCGLDDNILKDDLDIYYGGNYCTDFYNYLSQGIKRYQSIGIDSTELRPNFSYFELDRLKKIDANEILSKNDQDEIYQIYNKSYKNLVDEKKHNISDFYVWLVENHCILVEKYVSKTKRLKLKNNPFQSDCYHLDAERYLYNRGIINELSFSNTDIQDIEVKLKDIPKNRYRLDRSIKRMVVDKN